MHVVLIDASRVIIKTVEGLLSSAGHTITPFSDSALALDYVSNEQSVACVLTSLEVGPIDGIELCWKLRLIADNRRPLSILVMSCDHHSRSFSEVLDSGADDFMAKPPGRDELHARLRATERLLKLQRTLIEQADTDSLTRLLNRGAFIRHSHMCIRLLEMGSKLNAVLIDIDNFKLINDRHGHAVGDAVIRGVADALRETGVVSGRLGGEEFALLIEERSAGTAAVTAHLIRTRCSSLKIRGSDGKAICFTVSIGIAEYRSGEGIDSVLRRADVALYAAKVGGRNRVATSTGCDLIEFVS